MESSNLYHHLQLHQLQEQCFDYGLSSALLDWNPNISIDEDDEYYKHHSELDGLMFPGNTTTTSYLGGRNFHEAIIHSPSTSSNKATVKNEVLRAKRLSAVAMPSNQEQPKKPRNGSQRPSCPVPKVKKEKLGDRIAALHRLVAPFGKTDTSSVLTEAIGYIQFLHREIHGQASNIKNEDDKTTLDLKSRGLCLVPLSLTSYISSCQGYETKQW